MRNIGFIGVGVMGAFMVRNLMQKGFVVSVYTRHREKAEAIIAEGAMWCESVAACAKGRDAVITIVGYPADVEEVYFGEGGILASADPGTYLIDMTTTSPTQARRIYDAAGEKGLDALDAPVSGGDSGAKAGTLSIMVGGDEDAYDACLPILSAMGTNIVYEGGPGTGQHTKMANQIALAGAIAGVCETIAYGRANGLDTQRMLDSISKGAAGSWQMTNNGPKILDGDDAPGFYIKHYVKDLGIAADETAAAGQRLAVLDTVLAMYKELEAQGLGDLGTQALIRHYTEREG